MSGLAQDLRYALRQLRKSPAFTAVAVITLALGIGANTAVFSVMNAVLLRSLPVRDPQNLYYMQIGKGQDGPPSVSSTGNGNTSFSEPVFEALRERKDVFADLIAYAPTQDLGMKTTGLLVFGVTPQHAHTAEETLAFFRDLLDRMRGLPGVQGVTLMNHRLGSGWGSKHGEVLDGTKLQAQFGSRGTITTNDVGPDCFHVLGVPILEGRDVSDADTPASPPVVVVNETFAKRFLPNTSPLLHKLNGGRTIVGVVKDSKYTGVSEEPTPMAYYPALQKVKGGETFHIVVRSDAPPLALLPTIAKAVHEMEPNAPLEEPVTQQAEFERSYSQPAMFASLAGFFGALAAVLVATGLYGTLAYRTNRRTTEIGMRMALGAQRKQVIWMVMRESLLIGAAGVLVGLPLAFACARFLDSMLYQVSDFDAVSFVLALSAIALVGALRPFCRRAVRRRSIPWWPCATSNRS